MSKRFCLLRENKQTRFYAGCLANFLPLGDLSFLHLSTFRAIGLNWHIGSGPQVSRMAAMFFTLRQVVVKSVSLFWKPMEDRDVARAQHDHGVRHPNMWQKTSNLVNEYIACTNSIGIVLACTCFVARILKGDTNGLGCFMLSMIYRSLYSVFAEMTYGKVKILYLRTRTLKACFFIYILFSGEKVEKCYTGMSITRLYPRPWKVGSGSINFMFRGYESGLRFHYKGLGLSLRVPRESGPVYIPT
ncbi:hypothetical protein M9H77_18424 [Catharanthus roseus]|uniref:Uncharacterized protein n=1 Tax=Catharanthus roseus TaxID=4058 RepID=A0ACC0B7F7_CATRO|nr:hypothetical protein M9H77_18424 [Catharanthus roseus]